MTPNQRAVLDAARKAYGHGSIEDIMADTGLDRRRVVAAMKTLTRNGQIAYRNRRVVPTSRRPIDSPTHTHTQENR